MSDDVTQPSQALIVRPRVLPTASQFAIEQQLAWKLRNARGFLPNHFMVGDENERAAKILAAIEYARAVGIEPMIALQNTQVIDGKVGASALLIGALLRKAGYTITDDTDDARSVVTVSKNGTSVKGEFSMEDAARAQLVRSGSGWQKYPRDMMYARALTQAARRGAQDAVLGMAYTADELGGVEEEIAGVPALEGEAREVAPSVEAVTPQVSPAATSEAVPVPQASGSGSTPPPTASQGAQGSDQRELVVSESVPAAVTPAPPPASVTPLGGPAFARRMGAGRSVGPAPRRTNVVTVEPGSATVPATAPEADAQTAVSEPVATSQPAPPALTDEPVLPEPVDDGLASQRQILRESAGELLHVNAILENVKRGLEGKEAQFVPSKEPSEASDQALASRIDTEWPGRKLVNLKASELQSLLDRFEANLAKKRAVMVERGIKDE